MPIGIYDRSKSKPRTKLSEEHKRKISIAHKGMKHTKETRIKMGLAAIGKHIGVNSGMWKGGLPKCIDCSKGLSTYTSKRCHSCANKIRPGKNKSMIHSGSFKPGEKHWNWKGGICRNKHSVEAPAYKKWRNAVFKRDNYTCQKCKAKGGNGKRFYLEAHHKKSWANFPELRFNLDNGITFCKKCHKKCHKKSAS